MSLIQLAYVSRATFKTYASGRGVEPNVARILLTSRRNNAALGVVGGLYYGDGCFFQYLEGEEAAVRSLFRAIAADSRHDDVRVVLDGPIEERSFQAWSMKYVPVAGDVDRFLRRNGMTEFDPYRFNLGMIREMVALIHRGANQDPPRRRAGPIDRRLTGLALAVLAGVALALVWTYLASP